MNDCYEKYIQRLFASKGEYINMKNIINVTCITKYEPDKISAISSVAGSKYPYETSIRSDTSKNNLCDEFRKALINCIDKYK